MRIIVFGATGTVGSAVVNELSKRGAAVRAFVREEGGTRKLPTVVEVAVGDLLDPLSIEAALDGVSKMFLLNAVTPDELTQALFAYHKAKEAGIKHITYLSVFRPEQSRDVPHIAAKFAMESVLRESGIPFTILRPGSFFQNDAGYKEPLLNGGIYPSPVGDAELAAIDTRDIGEAAAISLTEEGHAGKTYNLVAPSPLNAKTNAALWSKLLAKEVRYQPVDLGTWEAQMRHLMPAWMSYDLRLMFAGVFERGFTSTTMQSEKLQQLLGRPPRTYEAFASELAALWTGK